MDPKCILKEDVEIEFNFLIIGQGRWKQKPIRKLAFVLFILLVLYAATCYISTTLLIHLLSII